MRYLGLTYNNAFKLLLSKRKIVKPNAYFMLQLKNYEKTALSYYSATLKEATEKEEAKECIYVCSKCNTLLFKTESLVKHSEGKAMCSSYFVEEQSWMKVLTSVNEGIIACPNIKVSYLSYKCSVGRW